MGSAVTLAVSRRCRPWSSVVPSGGSEPRDLNLQVGNLGWRDAGKDHFERPVQWCPVRTGPGPYPQTQNPITCNIIFMELFPSLAGRLALSGLFVILAIGSLVYEVHPKGIYLFATAAPMIAFTILAIRGFRIGVICKNSDVTIRGLLWTRTIPRASITEITDFPAVRWLTPDGRKRWTPIYVFRSNSRQLAKTMAMNECNIIKLRRWVKRCT